MKIVVFEAKGHTHTDFSLLLQELYPDAAVVWVSDFEKAIESLGNEAPDMVVIDSNVPPTDAIGLIGDIRESSDVPLIVM